MLILSRKVGEALIIDENIEIRILSKKGRSVSLGMNLPKEVKVVREELLLRSKTKSKNKKKTLINMKKNIIISKQKARR